MKTDAGTRLVVARQMGLARGAALEALKQLTKLHTVLSGDDFDNKLIELQHLAHHAGYSNSIGTAWAELVTAAGAVNAILEAGGLG